MTASPPLNAGKPTQTPNELRPLPAPPLMFKLMNPILKTFLRSPFHGAMSSRLMLLTFTGRKTGKKFSTPVGYVRQGNTLLVFTHSPWWKNLIGGAPVTVRLAGRDLNGTGRPVDDPITLKQMVRDLIAANGEARSRQMGLWSDNADASPEAVKQAMQGTIFIRIELAEGKP